MTPYIGLMSGTSMDAVDAVLVDFADERAVLLASYREPVPEALHTALLGTRRQMPGLSLEEYGRLHIRLGRLFAQAALGLLATIDVPKTQIAAIGSHGQTVLHKPDGPEPFTLQIGDPSTIANLTGISTVADFRSGDIAAGGQGAPLTPGFHRAQFGTEGTNRVVLNIGGIANITVLPSEASSPMIGFDTGPGNAILDDWALEHLGTPMDRDARWAQSGVVNPSLLAKAKADPYFGRSPPKSTGRDYFNLGWINALLADTEPQPCAADVQATLVQLTAESIVDAVLGHAPATREILVCGGGAHNPELMRAIVQAAPECRVASTLCYGLSPDHIEAMAFAWLAKCRMEGRPGNVPSVTGARTSVVLGAIYSA